MYKFCTVVVLTFFLVKFSFNYKFSQQHVLVNSVQISKIFFKYSIFTENKNNLSVIAKNLNTNNPRIVLEKIKLIIHDNNSKYYNFKF